MSDKPSVETQLEIQRYETETIKSLIIKLDTKFDGMQSFMNKLYEVFVTHKELSDLKEAGERERESLRLEIKEVKKENAENKREINKLTTRAAFISGIGFLAVLLKDVVIDAIVSAFKR